MMEMTTTDTTARLSQPPSTICGGFIDINGVWNNGSFLLYLQKMSQFLSIGFACPIQNLVQYYCCGAEYEHFCCPPDRLSWELSNSDEAIYISGQYRPTNHIVIDQHQNRSVLIDHSKLIKQQFEQFQKIFLPIFLLTSSILFLIGIAIWFWLYKHKAFYATERDDVEKQENFVRRRSSIPLAQKRNSTIPIADRQSRRISRPSTEV